MSPSSKLICFILFGGLSGICAIPAHAGLLDDLRTARAQEAAGDVVQVSTRYQRYAVPEPEFEEVEDPRFSAAPEEDWAAYDEEEANWRRARYEEQRRAWAVPQDETYSQEPPARRIYHQEASYQRSEEIESDGWVDTDRGTKPITRQEVQFASKEKPGTIIIDTGKRRLYYILGNNRAIQYGIGVGKPGFEWAGVKTITRKQEWPDWRPPEAMIRRRPDLPRFMPGGPSNPLGARAMYLGSSLYRIHGSNEPQTIGQAVSSGCIRMINADVIDLYNRVKVGTKVVVR